MNDEDLLAKLCGVSTDDAVAQRFNRASEPTHRMRDDLVRILFGLAAWHRAALREGNGRGYGSITGDALLVDADDRLLLHLPPRSPSACESVRKNDVGARYFVHPGDPPRPIDDLVALGVATAELLVSPANRPEISPSTKNYRRRLADALGKSPLNDSRHRRRNQLIMLLLSADQRGLSSVAACLDQAGELVRLNDIAGIKTVGTLEALKMRLGPALAVISLAAIGLAPAFGGFVGYSFADDTRQVATLEQSLTQRDGELTSTRSSIARYESVVREKDKTISERDQQIEKLRTELKLCYGEPSPEPPLVSTAGIRASEAYRMFAEVPPLSNDTEFKRLMDQEHLDQKDFETVKGELSAVTEAAAIWWDLVLKESDLNQLNATIDGQNDLEVTRVLKQWRAEILQKKSYAIDVHGRGFEDDDGGRYGLTINEKYTTLTSDSDRNLAAEGDVPAFVWNYKEPIVILLEDLGWPYDSTVLERQLTGPLSLCRLAITKFSSKGCSLRFSVRNLPGPPEASLTLARNSSPPNLPVKTGAALSETASKQGMPSEKKSSPSNKQSTISPADVLKEELK